MPRPQKFNEQQVLTKAMLYFWKHGYSASSIQELLDEMGISRGTLYNAIGDKDALFKKALDLFIEMEKRLLAMTLHNSKLSSAKRIEQFLMLSFNDNPSVPVGCLMVNTLCEDDRSLEPFKKQSSEGLEHVKQGLMACFESIQKDKGSLGMGVSCEQASDVLLTQVKGGRVRQREGEKGSEILKDLLALLTLLTS